MSEVKQPNKQQLIAELDRIIKELQQLREQWSATASELTMTPTEETPPIVQREEFKEEDFFAPIDDLSLDDLFVARETESKRDIKEINAEEAIGERETSSAIHFTLIDRLSLLDNYHFAQGLFAGNQAELRNVLCDLEKMSSLSQAKDYVLNRLGVDIESEVGKQFWAFIEQNSSPQ